MSKAPDLSELFDWGCKFVAVCSILHASFPPVADFDDYPRIQKAYKLFVRIVGYIAVNWRRNIQDQPSFTTGTTTAALNVVPKTVTVTGGDKGDVNVH